MGSSREWLLPTPTSKTTSATETPGNRDGSNPNTKTTTENLIFTPVNSSPTKTTKVSELVRMLNSTPDPQNLMVSATPAKTSPFSFLLNTIKRLIVAEGT